MGNPRILGINGLGRIGKLTLWYQVDRDDFDSIVVNVGRDVGTSLTTGSWKLSLVGATSHCSQNASA